GPQIRIDPPRLLRKVGTKEVSSHPDIKAQKLLIVEPSGDRPRAGRKEDLLRRIGIVSAADVERQPGPGSIAQLQRSPPSRIVKIGPFHPPLFTPDRKGISNRRRKIDLLRHRLLPQRL